MRKRTTPPEELFDMIPKNLRRAVENKIDGATDACWRVYSVVADRWGTKKGTLKECFDSNVWICKRARLSKNTVEPALRWLIEHRFLAAEHRVRVFTPAGTKKLKFGTNQEGISFINSVRAKGGKCKGPRRVLIPPATKPTIDDLGLVLTDKSNGIFRPKGTPIFDLSEENVLSEPGKNLREDTPIFEPNKEDNWGPKLEVPNYTHFNEIDKDEIPSDDMEGIVISSNPDSSVLSEIYLTAEDSLYPFAREELGTDRNPEHDPNFAICILVLSQLRSSGFIGAANYAFSKSSLRGQKLKFSLGHCIYAATRFNELGPWPEWFEELILNLEAEGISGLEFNIIKSFADNLSSTKNSLELAGNHGQVRGRKAKEILREGGCLYE